MAASSVDPSLSQVHRTAFLAAGLRAWHEAAGAEPKIFCDAYALSLSAMSMDEVKALGTRVPGDSASTCVLRSRFAEDRLAAARGRLKQYVILGAGLDSYALRMGDQLGALRVFEVDDPPMLAWKQRRIDSLSLKTPKQLIYVPCDFEEMSIGQALSARDFDADAPCFISWLGVTQYLTRDAINETLHWASARPAGSEIVLTFVEPGAQDSRGATGTPIVDFTSFIPTEEMVAMLAQAGFGQIDVLSPQRAQEMYFVGRADGLVAPRYQRIIAASVSPSK
jgi:methyltransferase (TIGR00027 family)